MNMLTILTSRKFWAAWLLSVAAALAPLVYATLAHGQEETPAESKTPDSAPDSAAGKKPAKPAGAEPAAADAPMPQQYPADTKTLLITAMENNPDILVGKTDVGEAEAELNRVVLDVARKVVAAKSALRVRQIEFQNTTRLFDIKVVDATMVQIEKGKLIAMEADLRYLVGLRNGLPAQENEAGGGPDVDEMQIELEKPAEDISGETGIDVLLTKAMEHNPDIRLAKAKLRGARAELNRTRLDAARKVVTLQESVRARRTKVAKLRNAITKVPGSVPKYEVEDALASLAAAEAELEYVLGRPSLSELERPAGIPSPDGAEGK
jgi:hypothetical protein